MRRRSLAVVKQLIVLGGEVRSAPTAHKKDSAFFRTEPFYIYTFFKYSSKAAFYLHYYFTARLPKRSMAQRKPIQEVLRS